VLGRPTSPRRRGGGGARPDRGVPARGVPAVRVRAPAARRAGPHRNATCGVRRCCGSGSSSLWPTERGSPPRCARSIGMIDARAVGKILATPTRSRRPRVRVSGGLTANVRTDHRGKRRRQGGDRRHPDRRQPVRRIGHQRRELRRFHCRPQELPYTVIDNVTTASSPQLKNIIETHVPVARHFGLREHDSWHTAQGLAPLGALVAPGPPPVAGRAGDAGLGGDMGNGATGGHALEQHAPVDSQTGIAVAMRPPCGCERRQPTPRSQVSPCSSRHAVNNAHGHYSQAPLRASPGRPRVARAPVRAGCATRDHRRSRRRSRRRP
jgi:hypothetical protein